MDDLPLVMLGIRTLWQTELDCTPSDLVFGMTVAVPGVFFDKIDRSELPTTDFVENLYRSMAELKPTEMAHHSTPRVSVPKSLDTTSHVFIRTDAVRQPLVRPYTGPFKVLKKTAKYFIVEKNGKPDSVSVDRLKPAFIHQESESRNNNRETTNDVIRPGNSNPVSETPPEPETKKKRGRPKKSYSDAVKSSPTVITRSGRVSRQPRT